jgi:predicted RecA/RadA family phage recombinase
MAQTAAKRISSNGSTIDYTPASAVVAGDVINVGTVPMVATQAIAASALGSLACEGVFDIPKTSDVFTAGDAVYWNSSGTPVTGDASSGAADNATGNPMGLAVANAANTASYVRVYMSAAKRSATVAGAVTASGITAEDSSLSILGLAGNAGAGGAIPITAGAGDGNAAGGAVTITAGAGAGTGDGGASLLVGGASGAGASSNGGAVTLTGGAATSAASGDGGAVAITGGAGPTAGNTGGAVTILSGAGDGTNGTAGAVLIDSSGTGNVKGAITIGTNAVSLTLGKMPRVPLSAVVNAAGGNIATATALTERVNIIAASDNAKGVQLPSCVDGAQCVVINMVTDKTLLIYPPTAKQVNLAGANNAITVAANTVSHFYSEGANAWYGFTCAADVA